MIDDVLAIPDHLRDALWRVESARLRPEEAAGVMVCGVGGSAIGGDLAAAVLGDRLSGPLLSVRDYGLPSWATAEWTALCCSYSGQTAETLACFESARALGARRVVASTGGALVEAAREAGDPVIGLPGLLPTPRTAVAYMLVCAVATAAVAGIAPSLGEEIEAAAAFLDAVKDDLRREANETAAVLVESVPVVYGAGLTAPIARRWKTQINENAKLPAFFSELPEADHNELSGWEGATGLCAVLLIDAEDARLTRHLLLTGEAVEAAGGTVVRLQTVGMSRVERLLWALMLGDLVSLELAGRRGVDPLPIEAIDRLRAALGGS